MFSKIVALSALLAAANAGLLGNAHSLASHNIVLHDAPAIHYANSDAHYGAPVIHSESHDTYIVAFGAMLVAANANLVGHGHATSHQNVIRHDEPIHYAAPAVHYATPIVQHAAPVAHYDGHDTYIVALSALLAAANAGLLGNAHSSASLNIVHHDVPVHNADAHYGAPVIHSDSHDTYIQRRCTQLRSLRTPCSPARK
ncbi:unnamed protein product [Arctia plantaginis]|uniref:Uncharacterized protein n=1 Tax=Arctia plantaginis TaxID=874455 RepID=A0A8S1ADT6_ARCPL|nr:unnamed protein product [Arctia plantaginis]